MSAEPDSFDLDAAWVRRAQNDLPAFMEALATRLDTSLPGRVTIDRRRDGLFGRNSHIREIAVEADGVRFDLVFDKQRLRATRAKSIRGVVIGTTELSVEQWLSEVRTHIEGLAGSLSGASTVLKNFL